jgi:hypothetical protein
MENGSRMSVDSPITQWLVESYRGDRAALDQLMAASRGTRRLAESYLQSERADHATGNRAGS